MQSHLISLKYLRWFAGKELKAVGAQMATRGRQRKLYRLGGEICSTLCSWQYVRHCTTIHAEFVTNVSRDIIFWPDMQRVFNKVKAPRQTQASTLATHVQSELHPCDMSIYPVYWGGGVAVVEQECTLGRSGCNPSLAPHAIPSWTQPFTDFRVPR